ncbi:uncharacterized protein [Amphiura filiformis]|uniref:uncharacterized protein n=1 Tax=Amphiura filiformis TaxID=82378 RepID=UPI003B228140
MNKGNNFLSRHERRLTSSYSNLTKISPTATPVYTRPHGGFKGVSEQYPLSVYGFDKPSQYIENVKNCVKTQYVDEENERCGSPQWVPRYNSDINHTGEQPLIVQQFLSGNKQEQRNGVLPSHVDVPPRLKSASHRHREERQDYHHGNSTHQYLTATEMPGQSHQLFDMRLGRPTRTSLLRTRYRSRSAPGVRALLEVNHLHKQQHMAAKTEDRFKSVDIPKDLQPLTESGETIHQFIIGARYNRNVFRDANYLAATGVNVSKRDQQAPIHFPNGRSTDNGYLTNSSDSFASTSIPNASHQPRRTKEAWGSSPSLSKSRPVSRNTSTAPTPTPLASRETFAHPSGAAIAAAKATQSSLQQVHQSVTNSKTIIDGRALHKSHPGVEISGCEDCVMCRKGVPFKGKGMPGTFSKKVDPATKRTGVGGHNNGEDKMDKYIQSVNKERNASDTTDHDTIDHQRVQQYHLRILGLKMGVEDNRPISPRAKLHYNSAHSARYRPASSRQQFNKNKNNSSRSSTDDLSIDEVNQGNRIMDDDKISMRSSMISIRIDTPNFEEEDAMSTARDTPRDGNEEQNQTVTPEGNQRGSESGNIDESNGDRCTTIEHTSVEVTNDLHEAQIQDENGNHETVDEHDDTKKAASGDIQVDTDAVKDVGCLPNPTEMSRGDEGDGEGKMTASGISDAMENMEISSNKGNDAAEC